MTNKNLRYKGMRVNAFGLPIVDKFKNNYAEKNNRQKINPYHQHLSFESSFSESAPKNLIVMYDVPQGMKKEREWFRRHLVKFGYVMIQKSIWVGPSPLPKDFLDYLKEIKIGDKFKTFKLAKPYNLSISSIA
jgi:hypothetical protein